MIALFILASLSIINAGPSCLTSSEDFAVETVIPEYNLHALNSITAPENSLYALQSQYNENLITMIRETTNPDGLSIRLQIPTEISELKIPRTRIVSTSATGSPRSNLGSEFAGWEIDCLDSTCVFQKNKLSLVSRELSNQMEITVEVNEALEPCSESCSGICFQTSNSVCLDSKKLNDINTLLRYSGLSTNFEELLKSYRVTGTQEVILTEIVPATSPYINWKEALRQELVYLTQKKVISLEREEIESIALLTKLGQAGKNYRIVHEPSLDEWTYYDQTPDATLTSQRECNSYTLEDSTNLPNTKSLFYIVPLTIISVSLVIFIILIIVARTISRKSSPRKSPKL